MSERPCLQRKTRDTCLHGIIITSEPCLQYLINIGSQKKAHFNNLNTATITKLSNDSHTFLQFTRIEVISEKKHIREYFQKNSTATTTNHCDNSQRSHTVTAAESR